MLRRDILKSLLALAALPMFGETGLPGIAHAQPRSTRRFVDAHCHFFNAADIPIRGFLERVVFEDYPETQVVNRALGASLDLPIWRGLVATLADFLLKAGAPTPRQELQCLAQGAACGDFSAESPERALTLAPSDSPAAPPPKARELSNALQERLEQSERRGAVPAEQVDQADVDAFLEAVLAEMKAEGRIPAEVTSRSLRSGVTARAGFFDDIASYLFGSTRFGRYFRWARLLTGYRSSIAQTYQTLYDPGRTRLIIATPALVDYNFWLEDESPAALRDQVEVMSRISLRQNRPMHGFAPFDPLRELRHKPADPSALAIVQEAVRERGFIGVKLYSPMGFRPSGNGEGLDFPAFAHQNQADFGKRLDAALDGLYAWCEAEDVPILAHTLDSQAANKKFGARANPKFWLKVLEARPGLRINMAHFGNFLFEDANGPQNLKNTWEFQVGGFVKGGQFKNVYADLSYLGSILGDGLQSPKRPQIKALFSEYFSTFDPNAERLIFGTDWTMMARENNADRYLDNMEAFFTEIGLNGAQLDNIFYKNGLRFLGLSEPTKVSERLKAFYQANNKPMPAFT
jgi:predicted TIM-barrel fold metal-dependent hydrolase